MTLSLDADVVAAIVRLAGEAKADAVKAGVKPPQLGVVASDIIRRGLEVMGRGSKD